MGRQSSAHVVESIEPRILLAFFGLDPSFGQTGFATTSFGPANLSNVEFVKAQPDGKVLAVGEGNHSVAMARYLADGSPDTTFGSNGIEQGPAVDTVRDAIVQADGKILVAGAVSYKFLVMRFTAVGQVDTTFGSNGMATADFGKADRFNNSFIRGIALQPDGKIVVTGRRDTFDTTTQVQHRSVGVARFNTDGSLDNTFDSDGQELLQPGTFPEGEAIDVTAAGRILIAGENPGEGAFVLRLKPGGAFDKTLAGTGSISFSNGDVVLGGVRKILATDNTHFLVSAQEVLYRFLSDGTPDDAHGRAVYLADWKVGQTSAIEDFAVDSAGNIVGIVDSSENTVTVVRAAADGGRDSSFASDGQIHITDIAAAHAITISDDGKIYIGRARGFSVGRIILQTGVSLVNHVLVIRGTDAADDIDLEQSGNFVLPKLNGATYTYPLADISRIDIDSGWGDDKVQVLVPRELFASLGRGDNQLSTNCTKLHIYASLGNDTISTTCVTGVIDAGDGDNTIHVNHGFLTIFTGGGNDRIDAPASESKIIESGEGDDSILTGSGNDTIDAGDGNNTIISAGGDDQISTRFGNNSISTGDGNDTVLTNIGNDTIDTGAGDDDIPGFSGGTKVIITGEGDDTIGTDFNRASIGDGSIDAGPGNDHIFAGTQDRGITITAGAGNDDVIALGLATIFGDAGNDSLHAEGEGSVIHGGDGADTIRGTDFADSLYGDGGKDLIYGSYGGDLLNGGGGNDRLLGQQGKDRLYGGAGNDRLDAGTGADRVTGGSGDDTAFLRDLFPDTFDGGPGTDSAQVDSKLDVLTSVENLLA